MATNEDHGAVGDPHRKGKQYLGIEKVAGTHCLLGDQRADKQTAGHARQAEEKTLQSDLIRRPPAGGSHGMVGALDFKRRS